MDPPNVLLGLDHRYLIATALRLHGYRVMASPRIKPNINLVDFDLAHVLDGSPQVILQSGAHWRDLPERYGKWKTLHKRITRWSKAGVWEEVFGALVKDRDNQYLMLDSTIVRAHQQAAT